MRYFKLISNGYILAIGTGLGGDEIMQSEYNNIMSVILNKPKGTSTMAYRLKTDLTWESYEIEIELEEQEPDDTEDKAEAYDILMGVSE